MPDNRLTTLNAVHLSETTKDWAEALNNNFAELDERKTDIGDTSTLVHDGSYVHTDNNYTTAEKNKLAGVATGAQVNVLEGVKVNGTALTPTNKVVDVTVPTKVSDLTNDEGYTKVEASSANGKVKIDGVDTTVYTEPADVMHDGDVPSWALEPTKPSYTATEVGAIPTTAKGVANGVASLDNNGKVPSTQLPSYVDDVLEYASISSFPATGESGKIYIAIDTNKTYRWTGTQYVEVSESLALGETSSTAFAGDKGKVAYDHATDSGKISSAVASGFYKFSATDEGHIGSTTEVEKADLTGLIGYPAKQQYGTEYSLVTTGDRYYWDAKQNALASQTAYSAKGTSTKVPQITTNSLGQVTGITEVDISYPEVDQKVVLSFDATGWTAGNDGYYTKSIATTKYPINCFNSNNKVVMATLGVTKSGTAVTAITIESDEPFAGYVVAL